MPHRELGTRADLSEILLHIPVVFEGFEVRPIRKISLHF